MNVLQAVVLGLVEGVTEYLPVSSTGHLILTAAALGLGGDDGRVGDMTHVKQAIDRFEVIIQGGAILAVAMVYWPRVRLMLRGVTSVAVPTLRGEPSRRGLHLLMLLVVAFLPAAVVGLTANKAIKAHLFAPLPVVGALLLGGLVMVLLAPWHRRRLAASASAHAGPSHADPLLALHWRGALFIGCMQVLAMWPGTSRSMVTMLGGMCIGLPPVAAAEFAFLLGLPTLGGASAKELSDALRESGWTGFVTSLGGTGPVLAGLAAATVSAAISVKWLVHYLGRHTLELFGWWRVAVAGAFAWAIAMGWIAR